MQQTHVDYFKDSATLIIGGSYGFGRDIADGLAQETNVIVLSRTPPKNVTEDKLIQWCELDLSDLIKSRGQLKKVLSELKHPLRAVFYAAVYYGPRRINFLEMTESDWQRQLQVNLYGLWLSLSLTLPILKENTPSLFVHLFSEAGYDGGPGRAGYAATKAAASNLLDSLAQEDPIGVVRLVQLLPGIIREGNSFDYRDKNLSIYLQKVAYHLLHTRGDGMHGKHLALNQKGQLQEVFPIGR
jgi:NAD(P)-dependent dehydrogenase (short-subunit alcohol dehydrogenase family)